MEDSHGSGRLGLMDHLGYCGLSGLVGWVVMTWVVMVDGLGLTGLIDWVSLKVAVVVTWIVMVWIVMVDGLGLTGWIGGVSLKVVVVVMVWMMMVGGLGLMGWVVGMVFVVDDDRGWEYLGKCRWIRGIC